MSVRLLVAVLVTVTAVVADTASASDRGVVQCASYCKQETDKLSKFKYHPGTTYEYAYQTDVVTSVAGADKNESRLHLSAIAKIHSRSACEFGLMLEEVVLETSNPSNSSEREKTQGLGSPLYALFSRAFPMHFSFQDGVVEELCHHNADPVWMVNMKRGILSAFQNSMPDFRTDSHVYETDVTGTCETHYTHAGLVGDHLVLRKSKNLQACSGRMDHYLSVQSAPYTSPPYAHPLPLVKSTHECEQRIGFNGQLEASICQESHIFRPFSSGESGAKTTVMQNLTLLRHYKDEEFSKGAPTYNRRTTLLFDEYNTTSKGPASSVKSVKTLVSDLVTRTRLGVDSESAAIFSNLVADLRTLKREDLEELLDQTTEEEDRRFLMDALPLVGTVESVRTMVVLWQKEQLTGAELDSWLGALPFQTRPDPRMLSALSPTLDGIPRPRAVLALSSLVHRVCSVFPNCVALPEVSTVMGRIERLLSKDCRAIGRQQTDTVILALRALGNTGQIRNKEAIAQCYETLANPLEVRLAAVNAWRRTSCDLQPSNHLLALYTDQRQDVEMRIAAYLAAMRCPSPFILRTVKDTLYSEEVNQVASFVWTHLTNLQETASPWKQGLRELVESEYLKNKFKTDARKFSRNYEGSMFFDKINAGLSAESNIVFSPQSYLPRSGNLNFTVDIFGESVNLFEIGGRAEGFESVVESIFAPSGMFPDENIASMLKNMNGGQPSEAENSINRLANAFDARNRLPQEPHAELYARIFGNELHYSRFHGLQELGESTESFMKPSELIKNLLQRSEIDFTKSMVFLDATYTMATAVGLPLELKMNGTATMRMQVKGRFDVANLFTSKRQLLVEGVIAPSASVLVIADMGVKAHYLQTGLTSVSTLQSNTYIDGKIHIDGGKLVEVTVNVPRDRVDLVNVSSRLYVRHDKNLVELQGVAQDREETAGCSSDFAAAITGFKMCGHLSYANASRVPHAPYFPLTGPFNYSVSLFKTDSFNSYNLMYRFDKDYPDSPSSPVSWSLAFDTPGSKINRKMRAFLSVDLMQLAVRLGLTSPWSVLGASGKANLGHDKRSLDAEITVDGRELISVAASCVQTAGSENNNTNSGKIQPTMTVNWRRRPLLDVRGTVSYVTNSKYSADLTVGGLTQTPIHVSVGVIRADTKWDLTASAKATGIDASIQGNARYAPPHYISTKLLVNYKIKNKQRQSIDFISKFYTNSRGSLSTRGAALHLTTTQWPQYDVVASANLQRSDNFWESNQQLGLGATIWSAQQLYRNRHPNDHTDFAVKLTLGCPAKNIDHQFILQHQTGDTSLTSRALVQYSKSVRWNAQLELANVIEDGMNKYSMLTELACPWRILGLAANVTEKNRGAYQATALGRYEVTVPNGRNEYHELVVNGTYVDSSTSTSAHHTLNLDATFPRSAGSWAAPVKISGAIAAANGRLHQWIQLERSGAKYRIDADYTKNRYHIVDVILRLDTKGYKGRLAVLNEATEKGLILDLQFTKRFVFDTKISCDGEKHTVAVEMFWDKDVDPSKRVALHAEADSESNQAELALPNQYVKLNVIKLPNGFSSKLEWTEGETITLGAEWLLATENGKVSARLTTPFRGYELQTIAAVYSLQEFQSTAQIDFTWSDQMLTLSLFEGSEPGSLRANMEINSSWPILRSVKVAVSHSDVKEGTTRNMKSNASVEYNGKVTAAELTLRAPKNGLFGTASFKSPLDFLPALSGSFTWEQESDKHSGSVQMSWAPGREAGALFQLDMGNQPHALLRITTPFAGYEFTSAEMFYSRSAEKILLDMNGEFNRRTASFALEGQRTDVALSGSVKVSSPFSENMVIKGHHDIRRRKVKDTLEVTYAGKVILSFDLDGELRVAPFVMIGKFFVPGHNVKLSVQNAVSNSGFNTFLKGEWNRDAVSLKMEGEFKKEDEATIMFYKMVLEGSVLPQEMALVFEHTHRPWSFYTNKLILPGGIYLEHALEFEGSLGWKSRITVNTPSKTGSIINVHKYSEDGLDFKHDTLIELNGKKASASLSFGKHMTGYLRDVKCVVMSPWTDPISVTFNLPIENENVYRPKFVFEYKKNKQISAESRVEIKRTDAHVDLELKAPFSAPVRVTAEINMKGSPKSSQIVVKWEDKIMNIDTSAEFTKLKSLLSIKVSRPDLDLYIFQGEVGYDARNPTKTANIVINNGGQKWYAKVGGGILPRMYSVYLDYNLPIENWGSLSIVGDIDLTKPTKQAVVKYERDSESLIVSATASLEKTAAQISLSLDSKIPGIETASFLAAYHKSTDDLHGLQLAYKQTSFFMSLDGNLKTNDKGFANVTLNTSIKGYEVMTVSFDYDLTGEIQAVSLTVTKNEWIAKFGGTSDLDQRGVGSAKLNLELPYKGLEQIHASLRQEVDNVKRTINVVLTDNLQEVSLLGSVLTPERGGVFINAALKTPFRNFETIKGHLNVSSPMEKRKSASVSLNRNEYKFEASGEIQIERLTGSGGLKISTPVLDYESFDSEFSYDLTGMNKKAYVSCTLPGNNKNGVNVNIKSSRFRNGEMLIDARLPLLNIPRIDIKSKYDCSSGTKYAEFDVMLDQQYKFASAKIETDVNSVTAHLVTPKENFRDINFNGKISTLDGKKVITAQLKNSNSESKLLMEAYLTQLVTNVVINATTPFEGWNRVAIVGKYDVSKERKSGLLLLSKNYDIIFYTSANGVIEMNTGDADVSVSTTIADFGSVAYKGGYDFSESFSAGVSQERDGVIKEVSCRVSATRDCAEINVHTPFEGYEDVTVSGNYNLTDMKTLGIEVNTNGEKKSFAIELSNKNKIMKLNIKTPFSKLRTMNILLNYGGLLNGDGKFYSLAAEGKANDEHFFQTEGKLTLDWENRLALDAKMDAPMIANILNELSLECMIMPEFPPRAVKFILNNQDQLTFSFVSDIYNVYDGGFTFSAAAKTKQVDNRFKFDFYPKQVFVKLALTGNGDVVSAELEFDPANNKVLAEYKSPVEAYRHVGLGWQHGPTYIKAWMKTPIKEIDNLNVSSEFFVTQADNSSVRVNAFRNEEEFDLDFALSYRKQFVESHLAIRTPYKKYETLMSSISYEMKNSTILGFATVQKSDRVCNVIGEVTVKNLAANAFVLMTTPYDGYKKVHLQGQYDLSKRGHKEASVIGDFEEERRVNCRFGLLYSGSRSSIEIISEAPIPVATFTISGEYDYASATNTWNIKSAIKMGNVEADVSSTFVKNKEGQLNVFYNIQENSRRLKMNWQLENLLKHKKAGFTIDLGGGKKIEAIASMYLDGFSNVETEVSITSLNAQTYSLTAQWNMARSNVIAGNIGLQWARGKEIKLEGNLEIGGPKKPVRLDVKLTSPIPHLESVSFKSVVTYDNDINVESSLEWDKTERIGLSSQFSHSALHTKSRVHFTTPFTQPLLFTFSQDHAGLLEAVFLLGDDRYELTGNVSHFSQLHFEVDFSLTTPQPGLSLVKLKGEYSLEYAEKSISAYFQKESDTTSIKASLKTEPKRHSVMFLVRSMGNEWFANGKLDRSNGIVADATARLSETEMITLSLNWVPTKFNFEAETPYTGYSRLTAKYLIDLQENKKRGQIGASWEKNEVDVKGSLDLTDSNNVEFEFEALTPYTEYIAASGTYTRDKEHHVVMMVKDKKKSSKVEGKLRFEKKEQQMEMHFESSKDDYRGIEVKAGYILNKPGGNKMVHLNMRVAEHTIRLRAEGAVTSDSVSGSVRVDSSFKNAKILELSVNLHRSTSGNLRGNVNMKRNENSYQIRGTGTYQPGDIRGKISVETPGKVAKQIFIISRYSSNSINLAVGTDDKKFEFDGIYDLAGPRFSVNATLKSPYIDILQHLALRTVVDTEDLHAYLLAQWTPEHKIITQAQIINNQLLLKLETPFRSWETVEVSGQYTRNDLAVYDLESQAHWNDFEIKFTGSLNSEPSDFGVRGKLEWEEDKSIDLDATVQVAGGDNLNNIQCKFRLQTPFQQLSDMEMDFALDMATKGHLSSRLTLTTPFEMLPELHSSLVLRNDDYRQMSGRIEATALNRQMLVAANISNDALQNMNLKLDIQIPFLEIPPITVEGYMNQKEWRNVDSYIEILLPRNKYHVGGNYKLEEMNLDAKFIMNTPVLVTDVSFGGGLEYADITKTLNASAYYGPNNASLTYNFGKTDSSGSINMDIPAFKIRAASVDLKVSYEKDIKATVTYHMFGNSGSAYSFIGLKPTSLNAIAELDIPQLLGPNRRRAQLVLEFDVPKFYSGVLTYENGQLHEMSLNINNKQYEASLSGRLNSSLVGDRSVSLVLAKDWTTLEFVFDKALVVRKNSKSGSINLVYKSKKHQVEYLINDQNRGIGGELKIDSPVIPSGKLIVNGTFIKNKNNVNVQLNCLHDSKNHSLSLLLTHAEDGRSTSAQTSLSSGERVIKLDAQASFDDHNAKADLEFYFNEHVSQLKIKHKRQLPLHSELYIETPLLGLPIMRAAIHTVNKTVNAFAGTEKNGIMNYHLLLNAGVEREVGRAFFELEAPYVSFMRKLNLTGYFHTKTIFDTKIGLFFDFKSDTAYGKLDSMILLNREAANLLFQYHSPIEGFEQALFVVDLPFVLSRHMNARFKVILPNSNTYLVQGLFLNSKDEFVINLESSCKGRNLGFAFKIVYGPVYALEVDVATPFARHEHYRLDLKGQKNLIDGNEIVNYVEWNTRRIELRYSMMAGSGKFETKVQLTTPFPNYERYALSLAIENNVGKELSVRISHPRLKQDLEVEFKYTFNGLSDVSFLGRVSAADVHPAFESAFLLFKNKLNAANRTYTGILSALYNEESVSFSAEGMLRPGFLLSDIQATINSNQLLFQAKGGVVDELIEISLQLETPFEVIRNAEIFLQTSNEKIIGTEAYIIYNTQEYLGINVSRDDDNVTTFEARNSWRPISVSYLFESGSDTNILGEVCWNLNAKDTHKIRGQMNLQRVQDRNVLTSMLQVPTRILTFEAVCERSSERHEYGVAFSIEEGQNYGFKVTSDSDRADSSLTLSAKATLILPNRSLELSRQSVITWQDDGKALQLQRYGSEFLWDAAKDRSKKISVLVVRNTDDYEIKFHHGALSHDLIVRYINFSPVYRVEFEYSPLPEDMIIFQAHYKSNDSEFDSRISVRHDSSDVDLSVGVQSIATREKSSGTIKVKYLDGRTSQDRLLEIHGQISHVKPYIEGLIQTNENKISISGELWSKLNTYRGLTAAIQMNQKEPLTLKAHLNSQNDEPSINIDVLYGDSRSYHVFAGMPNHREIKASAHHNLFGTTTVDGLFTMRLNTSKLFWSRASWRPGMFDELQTGVLQEYGDLQYATKAIYLSFTDILKEDIENKWERVQPRIMTSLENVMEYNTYEKNAISNDLPDIMDKITTHYHNNDFFVKDISDVISSAASLAKGGTSNVAEHFLEIARVTYTALRSFVTLAFDVLKVDFTATLDVIPNLKVLGQNAMFHWNSTMTDLMEMRNATRKWTRGVLESAHNALHKLEVAVYAQMEAWDAFVTDVSRRCERAVVPALMAAQDIFAYINYHITQIQEYVTAFLNEVKTHLLSMEEVREILELYSQYSSWLEDFHVQDYFDQWLAEMNITLEWVVNDLRRTYADYKAYWDALYDAAFGHYENLNRLPPVTYARKLANQLYYKAIWAWRYYQLTYELRKGLIWILQELESTLLDLVNNIGTESSGRPTLEPTSSLVLDTSHGILEYRQILPIHWHGFDRLPEFHELSPYRIAQEQTADIGILDKYRYYMLDALNEYRTGLKLSRWLPPYGASAMLIGRHHYMTFDKQVYDFAGECSYLLTSDFVNSKFSAVVNYEVQKGKVQKKSVTIISDGHTIEIGKNRRIVIDGKKADTPIEIGDSATVTRQGDRVIVTSNYGLTVDCNTRYDVCSFDITGWHFGKTGGLLGTYDNEPANDLAFPTGELAQDDIANMTDAWKIGRKQCRVVNHAISTAAVEKHVTLAAKSVCNSYFMDSDSPLAPCFPRLDPSPFRAMCISDVQREANNPAKERAMCVSAAAYVDQCRRVGMELWVPQACVQCQLPDGNVRSAGEVKIFNGNAPQSADVVFVVEQADCLRYTQLEELPLKLDIALKRQGLTGNRFALVAFGGDKENTFRAPHTRTMEGQVWASARNSARAFNRLNATEIVNYPDKPVQDAYDALWMAARLPFRAGVSKTLVLVTCRECTGDMSQLVDDFGDITEMLTENDLTVHVMSPKAVRMRRPSSKQGRVFGADKQGVFTHRNVKNLEPSKQLLKQVAISKDLCTPLALETNGTVFNLDKLSIVTKTQGDGPVIPVLNKKFADVWARRVASEAKPSKCQKCDCVADQDGNGISLCQKCTSPSMEKFIKEWKDMKKGNDQEEVEPEPESDADYVYYYYYDEDETPDEHPDVV